MTKVKHAWRTNAHVCFERSNSVPGRNVITRGYSRFSGNERASPHSQISNLYTLMAEKSEAQSRVALSLPSARAGPDVPIHWMGTETNFTIRYRVSTRAKYAIIQCNGPRRIR